MCLDLAKFFSFCTGDSTPWRELLSAAQRAQLLALPTGRREIEEKDNHRKKRRRENTELLDNIISTTPLTKPKLIRRRRDFRLCSRLLSHALVSCAPCPRPRHPSPPFGVRARDDGAE